MPRSLPGTHRLPPDFAEFQQGSLIPLQEESSMTDPQGDQAPIQDSLESSEDTVGTSSSGALCSEHGETSESLPVSIEAFIRDRFSTKLEDPHTGRKVVYQPASGR